MTPLVIRRNRIVHLALRVTLAEAGTVIESTDQSGEHLVYLHGHGNLVPHLEATLQGKAQGDEFDVTVPDAFGSVIEEARTVLPRHAIDLPDNCEVGDAVTTPGPNGQIQLRLLAIDEQNVVLDGNHPLAGHALRYAGTVLKVERAHKDEIRHHRPHPAGHHLMVQDSSYDPSGQGPP